MENARLVCLHDQFFKLKPLYILESKPRATIQFSEQNHLLLFRAFYVQRLAQPFGDEGYVRYRATQHFVRSGARFRGTICPIVGKKQKVRKL